ncbi:DUF418 domain-containing protein [Candidatus Zixiibacteriota bacterium]
MPENLSSSADAESETVDKTRPRFAPVAALERVTSVDVIRGVALLGILGMNIYAFALPWVAYNNPLSYGAATGIHFGTWVFTHLFFDLKFMAIFSMLFGAGLVLMNQRAEAVGRKFGGIYYRRMLWLLLIGAAHAYLLWFGDILFFYAVCGLVLYPLRRRSPRLLIILGIVLLIIGMSIQIGGGMFFGFAREQAAGAEAAIAAGETPDELQSQMKKTWDEINNQWDPPPEKLAEDLAAHRGSYGETLANRVPMVVMMQLQALPFMFFWRIAGMMLLGMGLMKLGVFAAQRSRRFYLSWAIIGYALGLALVYVGIKQNMAHEFDFVFAWQSGNNFNYIGSLLVAMGHISTVMLICRSGIFAGLLRRLGAVGQMALTNYLLHTILLTPVFYGFGLGLYGSIDRFWLMGFVLGMWILQLIVSPIWLKHFRFGPAEWLWRTLTYGRRQPMRAGAES